ncbi:DMT family transporter [Sphaerisporangium rubeum]|uniref:Drug/metabolite transporter (DMT)-like permease n=1 Tax=Sphaerisporangium rubeum TaxID=321317 RepID=A0A7X0M9D3_9ACTN|nr:DMT family transporter [Sphaerisporangium rubeum]MBB6476778.1 drug/metabolite transporter (DMT)-like permease [Sphaerisporangium rubeum]
MPIGTASTLRLAALALLWGSNFLWIAIALRGTTPTQITLTRLALGALVLLAVTRAQHLKLPKQPALWFHLTIAALFANVIPYTLFAIAEQHITSSVTGVINATTPIWTALFAITTATDRHPSPLKLTGLLTGFLGTLLIFSPWQSATQITTWGGLAALTAAASYGISYVYMTRHLTNRGHPPLTLSTAQLITATTQLAIITPFTGGLHPPNLTWDVLLALTTLGTLGTGAAYVLNYRLITDEGTTASTVNYLLPVVAVILGAVVLSEPLTTPVTAGMLVVLIGVALTRRISHPHRRR